MKKKELKAEVKRLQYHAEIAAIEGRLMADAIKKLRVKNTQLQADLDKLQEECCAEVTALKAKIVDLEASLSMACQTAPHYWAPVDGLDDICCACDSLHCRTTLTIEEEYITIASEGQSMAFSLGDLRICRWVDSSRLP
jgi:hypothetical protein